MEDQDFTPVPRSRFSQKHPLFRQGSKDSVQSLEEVVECLGSGVQCDSDQENHEEEKESARTPKAPDGGWGWVVLAASVLVMCLQMSFLQCFGIFYRDLREEFDATHEETTWVPAIITAFMLCGGPLSSALTERFGCRLTVMVGGLMSGLATAVSSEATSIRQLYVTSAITGLGFCFGAQPSWTILGHYFDRYRSYADALMWTGPSVGQICFPQLASALLSWYGWRGSFLIMGGLLLNCCVCGAVMRPVPFGPDKLKRRSDVYDEPDTLQSPQKTRRLLDKIKGSLSHTFKFLYRHLAVDVLKTNARYRTFVLCVPWTTMSFSVANAYLVPYALDNNIPKDRATFLLTILGMVNVTVRAGICAILYRSRCSSSDRWMYVVAGAALVNGLSLCISGTWASFEVLVVYVVIFGASLSVFIVRINNLLRSVVETSRFHSCFGLLTLCQGAATLSGPSIAGKIVDTYGRYSYAFYMCGASVFLAGLVLMVFFCCHDNKLGDCGKMKLSPNKMKPTPNKKPDCEGIHVPS